MSLTIKLTKKINISIILLEIINSNSIYYVLTFDIFTTSG